MKYLSIIFLLICFGLLAHSQASADDVKDFQIEEVISVKVYLIIILKMKY